MSNICPVSGGLQVTVLASGEPGEKIDLYTCRTGAGPAGGWTLLRDSAPTDGLHEFTQFFSFQELEALAGFSGMFTAGRADLDQDFNGVSDTRQILLQPFDLPAQDRSQWGRTGLPNEIPDYSSQVVNVQDFGAAGDGVQDDVQAFEAALESLDGPGVVYIPPGTYRLTGKIYLDDFTILRGAGPDQTRLLFEGPETASRCIGMAKWTSSQIHPPQAILLSQPVGSRTVHVTDARSFQASDIVEIEQDNEDAWAFTDSWQDRLRGQIVRIQSVDPVLHQLTLDRPLRFDLDQNRNPKVQKLVTRQGAGVEDLYIEKIDAQEGHTIEMKYAVHCWVQRVSSRYTFTSHVWMDRCFETEVRDSFFEHAHAYGGGGQGYGVTCGRHTSDARVENNIFHHLRHAMIVGSGANGNVYGYNYAYNRALDPVRGTPQPDISVHGNYVFMNLFEGNVVEDADLPDYYHPAGPRNTLFRNRILNAGEAIEVGSHAQNVIGNVLPAGHITIDEGILNTICHGNQEIDQVQWDADCPNNLPASFYRSVRPSFFPEEAPSWPVFGPDCSSEGSNPAQLRSAEASSS